MRARLVRHPGGQPSACRDARRSDGRLNGLSKPPIARIQGPAYGGGVGLIACCDIAIASETSVFALSEARLGLAPAVIAPYVIAAVGQRQARRLFLTAARIDAQEAQRLGLVHRVVPAEHLDEAVEAEVGCLLAGGPEALAHCKRISLENLPKDPERTGSAELLTGSGPLPRPGRASPPSSKSAGPGGEINNGGTNKYVPGHRPGRETDPYPRHRRIVRRRRKRLRDLR